MKRTSFWKKASILLALVVTLSLSVVGLTSAAADGVTVGAFSGALPLNGTSSDATQNKTVITTTGDWNYASVTITGMSESDSLVLKLTPNADIHLQLSFYKNTVANDNILASNVNADLTANTQYNNTVALSSYVTGFESSDNLILAFYLDPNGGASKAGNKVVVDELTVGGVKYTPAEYVPEAHTPEKSFKAHTEWVANNATVSANTLEAMPDTDERYETAVSDGMGNIAIADTTQKVTIEIPLSEAITAWPTSWTNLYIKVKTTGVSKILGYVESENELNAFCNDFFGKAGNDWQCAVSNSVSDGYKSISVVANHATENTAKFFENYLKSNESITKIILSFEFETGATTANIEIAGMTFGNKQPVFINDVGAPELEIGEWAATDVAYAVTKDATVTVGEVSYTGLKIVYSQSVKDNTVYTTVNNFDAKKYPKLRVGYYADTVGKLSVAVNWGILKTKDSVVGYNVIDVDMSAVDMSTNKYLQFYLEGNTAQNFDNPKTLLIDTIQFYTPYEILKDEATSNGANLQIQDTTDGTLKWTVTNTDGAFWKIILPTENWYSFNRYLTLDIEFDTAIKLGVYFNSGNSENGSAVLLPHTDYGVGRYKMCLDTKTVAGYLTEGGKNSVFFFCDAGAANNLTKTVTVHSIDFSEEGFVTSPNANVVTLNYTNETVTFGTEYEASATSDFATLLTSGAAVTPGSKLYLRLAGGASEYTVITLPERPALNKSDITAPTVQDNFVRFGAAGFEYKLGNGEWKNSGFFDKLTAETEYTFYVRKAATANAFASAEVEYKVTTAKGGTDTKPAKKSCKSSIDFVTVGIIGGIALICGAAMFIKKREN